MLSSLWRKSVVPAESSPQAFQFLKLCFILSLS
jgi:hypothetical protein